MGLYDNIIIHFYRKYGWDLLKPTFTLIGNNIVRLKHVEEKIFFLNKTQKTEYYFVKNNVWPFFLSLSISFILIQVALFLHDHNFLGNSHGLAATFFFVSLYGWFRNLDAESLYENENTLSERKNIVQAFLFFLLIEFMTFAACFWVLFHCGLAPSIWIGALWPGEGIASVIVCENVTFNRYFNITTQLYDLEPCVVTYNSRGLSSTDYFNQIFPLYPETVRVHINLFDKGQLINPYKAPLINTFILLTSAATVTLSHKSLKLERYFLSIVFLVVTLLLGISFVKIQYLEYINSMVSGHDGIYGNTFFAITGLHGLHVIIGIIFLFVCLINIIFQKYSPNSHRSFEFAIWYWHFVDVIWVVVYFMLYLWPASFFFQKGINIWTISENYFCVNMSIDTYKDILYLQYLADINKNEHKLGWIPEYLQNYNFNLIKRDVEHYHLFLDMTREYIMTNVAVHHYREKVGYETYFVVFLMMFDYAVSNWFIFISIIAGVCVWFKTDGFDCSELKAKLKAELKHFIFLEKNKKAYLINNFKNFSTSTTKKVEDFQVYFTKFVFVSDIKSFVFGVKYDIKNVAFGVKDDIKDEITETIINFRNFYNITLKNFYNITLKNFYKQVFKVYILKFYLILKNSSFVVNLVNDKNATFLPSIINFYHNTIYFVTKIQDYFLLYYLKLFKKNVKKEGEKNPQNELAKEANKKVK